jgi:F-type H+-transporting ATPase subunit b
MSEILGTLGIDFRFVLIMAVGFLLLFLLLKKFAFGPIFNVLEQRQSTIRNNLDEAEARRNEMVALQKDYEQRLAKIEDEARDKIQAAVRDAQAARDEIIARAHTDRDAIMRRTQEEILREREKSLATMRDQIAEMAVTGASRILRQRLDVPNQGRIIDEVIAEIGTRNNTPQVSTQATAQGATQVLPAEENATVRLPAASGSTEVNVSDASGTTKTTTGNTTVIRFDNTNGGTS